MKAADFLTELWGETPPGLILIWELATKTSRYYQAPAGTVGIQPGSADLYTGVGLSSSKEQHSKTRRTPSDRIVAIPGLWADIDVNGGPEHKQGAAPDKVAALRVAEHVLTPTIVVDSGYGLQAWWLLEDGPWRFKTYDEQREAAKMAAQWQLLLRKAADFGLDYTHDLARVLRLPATSNGKGGDRVPVEVTEVTSHRYLLDELRDACSTAGDVDPGYHIGVTGYRPKVTCRPDTEIRWIDDLIANSPLFGRTWRHERDELPSMSEYDMSLASMAALAGRTDQEIADLICHHRKMKDPDGDKAERLDYVQRTVARSRCHDVPDEPVRKPTSNGKHTFGPEEWADHIYTKLQAPDEDTIALPFERLTKVTDGGIRPGTVTVVAGFTSHGKSIFVDMVADAAAGQDKKVHLYLTEMTAYERGLRLLARKSNVTFAKLRRRDITKDEAKAIVGELESLSYGVSIVADWTVDQVVEDIVKKKWDLAIIDLVHGFAYQDERDLSKTSSALVRAAKASADGDFGGTAIVTAAHLTDKQMDGQKSPKRPKPALHAIKGTTSLKQDPDMAFFVWLEDDEQGIPTQNGEIWLAKSRQSGLGGVKVLLDRARMQFVERVEVPS